jgi:aryl-alcohol dehydrogenase-like predicted oxidoreductase
LWAWGDVLTYGWGPSGGYDKKLNEHSIHTAFSAITKIFPKALFDTAEYYGHTDGQAEKEFGRMYSQLIGRVETQAEQDYVRDKFVMATKFLPTPWRHPWLYPKVVKDSLDGSLHRTHLDMIDIYQLHGPSHFGFWPRLSTLCDSLAEAYHTGRIKGVGTCNLNIEQVKYIHARLKEHGVPLVSNQVEFSLLRMDPLTNGLIEECRKLGVATIAYSPLGVGRLTGKYSNEQRPRGNRNFANISWSKIQPVVDELTAIGAKVGKSPSAVALNWIICKGAIPIPSAKNGQQVLDCAQALGWRLTKADERRLDAVGVVNGWDWNILKHVQNWWWQQG